MSIEATAEALAPETAAPIETVTDEAPQANEPDDLSALYDKLNAPDEAETPDEPSAEVAAESKPADEPESEPEEPKAEIPSDIPRQFKEHWEKLTPEVRTAIEDHSRETNRKLGEQGRMMQGISPIRDALVEATRSFPQMADMKPADVAKEVFNLAKVSADFQTKPLETMMGLVRQHGLEKQLAQVLQGQPVQQDNTNQMLQHIRKLESKLSEATNPEYLRSQMESFTSERNIMSEVENFANTAEHWDKVEDYLPQFVALERQMQPNGSEKDILKAAYESAVSRFVPTEQKAPDEAAEQAARYSDPEKTKAVLKAKSVNVTGKPGKPRPLTEDELLSQTFDRAQRQ